MNAKLLVIDPQIDFCSDMGALSVKGAAEDMERLANFISRRGPFISEIGITLDWHQYDHIAHPVRWVGRDGKNPAPFTLISVKDVQGPNPVWRASNSDLLFTNIDYVEQLEKSGRNKLVIWPPHCIAGTYGAMVYPELNPVIKDYQEKTNSPVTYFLKGQNQNTESYSAIRADVVDPLDKSTDFNLELLTRMFAGCDRLYVAGEASSHCVAQTVMDSIEFLGNRYAKKLVILKDCMSPVPGFESLQEDFFKKVEEKGARLVESTLV